MNVFVGGSLRNVHQYQDVCTAFVAALGNEVIRQIRGQPAAAAAHKTVPRPRSSAHANAAKRNAADQLPPGRCSRASPGRVQISRRGDWSSRIPSSIRRADCRCRRHGFRRRPGVPCCGELARIAESPSFLAQFGGAVRCCSTGSAAVLPRRRQSLTIDAFDISRTSSGPRAGRPEGRHYFSRVLRDHVGGFLADHVNRARR